MSWTEVKLIHSKFTDHELDMLYLARDYKMYGEKSYVFKNKKLLHDLYNTPSISMNDDYLRSEATSYHNSKGTIFKAFQKMYNPVLMPLAKQSSNWDTFFNNPNVVTYLTDAKNSDIFNMILDMTGTLEAITSNYQLLLKYTYNKDNILKKVNFSTRLSANGKVLFKNIFNTLKANEGAYNVTYSGGSYRPLSVYMPEGLAPSGFASTFAGFTSNYTSPPGTWITRIVGIFDIISIMRTLTLTNLEQSNVVYYMSEVHPGDPDYVPGHKKFIDLTPVSGGLDLNGHNVYCELYLFGDVKISAKVSVLPASYKPI